MKHKIFFIGFASILVAAIFVCAQSLMGENFGQWFYKSKSALFYSSEGEGNVSIIRGPTSYVLKQNIALMNGDEVITSMRSTVTLKRDKYFEISLDENSQITVKTSASLLTEIQANQGTIFIKASAMESNALRIFYEDISFLVKPNSALSLEVFSGTQTINVYSGSVELSFGSQRQKLESGSCAILLQDEDGNSRLSYTKIKAEMLSAFLIGMLLNEDNVCFNGEELNVVLKAGGNRSRA